MFVLSHISSSRRTGKKDVIRRISMFRMLAVIATASYFETACFGFSSPTPPLCTWTVAIDGCARARTRNDKKEVHSLGKRNLNRLRGRKESDSVMFRLHSLGSWSTFHSDHHRPLVSVTCSIWVVHLPLDLASFHFLDRMTVSNTIVLTVIFIL